MIQVYHSIFAELIRDFIAYKRAAGYKYETEAVYLKTFDDLCFSLNIDLQSLQKNSWTNGVRRNLMSQQDPVTSNVSAVSGSSPFS